LEAENKKKDAMLAWSTDPRPISKEDSGAESQSQQAAKEAGADATKTDYTSRPINRI
jgi:hypothetical protein